MNMNSKLLLKLSRILLNVFIFAYSYESAEEVFRTTVDIVTNRAKQNQEEISARWEPLFNNLGHCCRKNKKYKEALKYHQFVSFFFNFVDFVTSLLKCL